MSYKLISTQNEKVMKKTKNFLAVLLVALGTSTVVLAGETLKAESQVQVISYSKSDSYKLIYKNSGKQNVTINLVDEKGTSVHKGLAQVEGGFAQNYDFSYLPSGIYTFEVVSNGQKVAQTVNHVAKVEQLEQSVAVSSNKDTKKMVLRSSAELVSPLSVAIYGVEDELLFAEELKAEALTRVYDLSQIKGKGVRFTVSYNSTVVKDQKFDF